MASDKVRQQGRLVIMFSILFHPARTTSNPIARAELAYLREQSGKPDSRWLHGIDSLLIIPSLLFMIVPFITYIHPTNENFYILLLGFTTTTHLWIEVRILTYAVNTVRREQASATWEHLVVTGVNAREIIRGKWWAVVYHIRGRLLLMAVLRFALAVAAMQYLNIYLVSDCAAKPVINVFCYPSHNGIPAYPTPDNPPNPEFTYYFKWYPEPLPFVIAGIVTVIFSFAEGCLTAAIGLYVSFVSLHLTVVYTVIGLLMRLTMAVIGVIAVSLWIPNIWYHTGMHRLFWKPCPDYDSSNSTDYFDCQEWLRNGDRVPETIQVSVSTVVDSGSLLAANILRPIGSTQFIRRNIASAVFGFIIYDLLIRLSLRTAEALAVWRGASPTTR